MKERDDQQRHTEPDPRLDTPSEANREKHINFLDVEEESAGRDDRRRADDETRQRREQWEQGLEEGRKSRSGYTGTFREEGSQESA